MNTNYYQLPPDGVGKKVFSRKTKILYYANKTGTWKIGDIVTGLSSGLSMEILADHIFGATHGYIALKYLTRHNEASTNWINGEELVVNAISIATANGTGEDYFNNTSTITSFNDPYIGLKIDPQGQAYVRYLEGDQLLDAGGKSKNSQETTIGIYHFNNLAVEEQCVVTTSGNGSYSYDIPSHSITLQTDNTSGDSVSIKSDKFHPTSSEQGLYTEFILQIGDEGKDNVTRRGGLYYESNGFFLELEDGNMYFAIRSNGTGSVVDTYIPQSEFNVDKLDGTGPSLYSLNITNINKYWMDYSPFNRIRFGTFDATGNRVIMHVEVIGNDSPNPRVNSSALPINFEIFNTNSTASPSNMTIHQAIVSVEGCPEWRKRKFEKSSDEVLVTSNEWTPIISIKPDDIHDGSINRSLAKLQHMTVTSVTSADGSIDGRIKIEIFETANLSGATFSIQKEDATFLVDTDAYGMTNGKPFIEHMVKGTKDIDLKYLKFLDTYLCNKADGTPRVWTIAVKAIREDCQVAVGISWCEIGVVS